MIPLILLLVLSGVITTALYKRPDARAATLGGLRAGAAQADTEFRTGFRAARVRYDQAQKYLTRPTPSGKRPSPRNLRWWASAVFAVTGGTAAVAAGGTYGLLKVLGGAARIGKQAAVGARDAYREYKEAQPQEAEILDDEEEDAAPEQDPELPAAAEAAPGKEAPAVDLTPYDNQTTPATGGYIIDERITVNAEFTSFPQLQHDHATASTDMTQVAAAIDSQLAGLLSKNMGRGELVTAMVAAQETANQLAAQHARIATLAAGQNVVIEAHAAVGGTDNVADKEAYAGG